MTPDDAEAAVGLMDTVWGVAPADTEGAILRMRHLVATDPEGAWVSVDGDGVVDGAALALLREGIWGLSLLIVHPRRQSDGVGRALMDAATAYGAGARGGIIMASGDPRALRTYWRAGFTLRPSFDVRGKIRARPARDPAVREGRWPADRELVDATSRFVRTAAHGSDIDALLAAGRMLLVHDDGGFAFVGREKVSVVAAQDERVARLLLEAALAESEQASVEFVDALQDWALDVCLTAGLKLGPYGAVCVRGDVGPMRPYVPSGAYL